MPCKLWPYVATLRTEWNRTYEGSKPRPQMLLRLSNSVAAVKLAGAVGVGRAVRGSVVFEGQAIPAILDWLGVEDDALINAALAVADSAEFCSPLAQVEADWKRFQEVWDSFHARECEKRS